MLENQVSLTALMTAYIRAYHAMYDNPKIFDDFLAYSFIPKERRQLIEQGLANFLPKNDTEQDTPCTELAAKLANVMQSLAGTPNVLSRSRYTENKLKQAIGRGVKQYGILGAGMDTFAFRHPELLERIHVFEVDHPDTQDFKQQRVKELGWKISTQLHFVPADFTKDSLEEALLQESYDPKALSFFSWLGVTMYLTRDEIFNTLRTIKKLAPSGSTVIFDYMDTDSFIPEKVAPRVQMGMFLAQQAGEPMKTGLDPSNLAADLADIGLHLLENLSPSEIGERYFQGRTDNYYPCEHVHFAMAVLE